MKNIAFWSSIYWSCYMTMAFSLSIPAGKALPIFLIGAGLTCVLAGILLLLPNLTHAQALPEQAVRVEETNEEFKPLEVKPYVEEKTVEVAEVRDIDDSIQRSDDSDDAFD